LGIMRHRCALPSPDLFRFSDCYPRHDKLQMCRLSLSHQFGRSYKRRYWTAGIEPCPLDEGFEFLRHIEVTWSPTAQCLSALSSVPIAANQLLCKSRNSPLLCPMLPCATVTSSWTVITRSFAVSHLATSSPSTWDSPATRDSSKKWPTNIGL
jgi:hypothetical protein